MNTLLCFKGKLEEELELLLKRGVITVLPEKPEAKMWRERRNHTAVLLNAIRPRELQRTCIEQFPNNAKVGVRNAVVQSRVAVAVGHVGDMLQY